MVLLGPGFTTGVAASGLVHDSALDLVVSILVAFFEFFSRPRRRVFRAGAYERYKKPKWRWEGDCQVAGLG